MDDDKAPTRPRQGRGLRRTNDLRATTTTWGVAPLAPVLGDSHDLQGGFLGTSQIASEVDPSPALPTQIPMRISHHLSSIDESSQPSANTPTLTSNRASTILRLSTISLSQPLAVPAHPPNHSPTCQRRPLTTHQPSCNHQPLYHPSIGSSRASKTLRASEILRTLKYTLCQLLDHKSSILMAEMCCECRSLEKGCLDTWSQSARCVS